MILSPPFSEIGHRVDMDEGLLPSTFRAPPKGAHGLQTTSGSGRRPRSRLGKHSRVWKALLVVLLICIVNSASYLWSSISTESINVPLNAAEILDKCRLLNVKPGPPPDFSLRKQSDRFVVGTRATLIKVIPLLFLRLIKNVTDC